MFNLLYKFSSYTSKMPKELSTWFYQKSKERFQKELVKGIKIFLKKKKSDCRNMVMKRYKNLAKDERQRLAEYRKKYKIWKRKTTSQKKTG